MRIGNWASQSRRWIMGLCEQIYNVNDVVKVVSNIGNLEGNNYGVLSRTFNYLLTLDLGI